MHPSKTKKPRILLTKLLIFMALLTLIACGKSDNNNMIENTPEHSGQSADKAEEETLSSEAASSETLSSEELPPEAFDELSAEQKELYAAHIEELEQLLSDNSKQEQESDSYQEFISSIYLFSESYSGGVQADYSEEGTLAFQMLIKDDGTDEKQRYECRLLSDGSLWFTYQTESESAYDLPDYIVNEDVLRYSRADYVYDDGEKDIEEEKQIRRQKVDECMAQETGGEVQEFWCRQGSIYKIDRKEEAFVDMTEAKESCVADFLKEQHRRIDCQIHVSEASLAEVEKYKPEGYSLLWEKNAWDNIAVCDLNRDDKMDYVVALYPDDYEEIKRYDGFSPYERSSQYYAAGFWLLLSSGNGNYEKIQLSDNIEYSNDALALTEVAFVDEGILQLKYFIGRSPHRTAQLRFQYDKEEHNFYMLSSCCRKAVDDVMLIGDIDNYGKTSLYSYFAGTQHYDEGGFRRSVENIPLRDGNILSDYSDGFQYQCRNLLTERHINSLIWEKEYELLDALQQHYPQAELNIYMRAKDIFYNPTLVSGQVELSDYKRGVETLMPIMVDKQSGEYVMVTKLLEKEEFMQIFDNWSEDILSYGGITDEITVEEKERCERVIEKSWERADSVENYVGEKENVLFLQITQKGVRIGVWSETDEQMNYYIMDKEYFWGTRVWNYLKPNQTN